MFDNMFSGVMGKIGAGMCRLGVNGKIAIKTSSGYKTYNPDTGNLTDCSSFVLDIADDFFFLMPTRSLKAGDIVLINGRPMYILENKSKNRVEVMDYEDSSIKTVIPERHAVMGRKFYGKIVSLIGSGFGKGGGGFFKNMLKFKMMSSMMGGGSGGAFGGNSMAMMMLMGNGGMDGLFEGICGFDDEEDGSDEEETTTFTFFDDDEPDAPVTKKTKKTKKTKNTRRTNKEAE